MASLVPHCMSHKECQSQPAAPSIDMLPHCFMLCRAQMVGPSMQSARMPSCLSRYLMHKAQRGTAQEAATAVAQSSVAYLSQGLTSNKVTHVVAGVASGPHRRLQGVLRRH